MTLEDILEWDVFIWRKGLKFWMKKMTSNNKGKILGIEIGSRNGGLSLFFTKKYQANMICSDINKPSLLAEKLHQKYQVHNQIEYRSIDAKKIDYAECTFDIVVFKSVLGSLAGGDLFEQQKALKEMYRVLKPGGLLFFAENLKASPIHNFARNRFVPWGKSWRYISYLELKQALNIFSKVELKSAGFLSAFVPEIRFMKKIAEIIDSCIGLFIPSQWKYVGYGYAVK